MALIFTILNKVLYSKDINKNLIGGVKLAKDGYKTILTNENNEITLTLSINSIIIGKFKSNNLNIIRIPIRNEYLYDINSTELDNKSLMLWHCRLGHYYQDDINKYLQLHNIKTDNCIECKIAKLKNKPHNKTPPRANKVLEMIHSDIIGPINPTSNDNFKFIITFIDDFSRKSWIFLMKDKSNATSIITDFLKYLDNHYHGMVKFFKSDNGKEYNNSKVKRMCKKLGIKKVFSTPYNPQINGIAERYNQTLINSAKTLIHWSKLSLDFWSYAVTYSNYLYNITPHANISNLIPDEIFYNKTVDISKIKVFGCLTHYNNLPNRSSKIDINTKEGIFLGIDFDSNSYIVMDKESQTIHLVNNGVFIEDTPGNYTYKYDLNKYKRNKENINPNNLINDDKEFQQQSTINFKDYNNETQNLQNTPQNITNNDNNNNNSNNSEFPLSNNKDNMDIVPTNNDIINLNSERILKRQGSSLYNNSSKRTELDINQSNNLKRRASSLYNDFPKRHELVNDEQSINLIKKQNSIFSLLSQKAVNKNNSKYEIKDENRNKSQIIDTICYIELDIPQTFEQAMNSINKDKWIIATKEELFNLYRNKIMTVVTYVPKGKTLIRTRWVFAVKHDENNNITKYKARVVAKGFTQVHGIDYDLTYSPTLNTDSFRLLVHIAAKFHWKIIQLDIKSAYLNANLDKEIYCTIPPGDKNYGKGFWKLNKALYGLRQFGRQWYKTISNFITSNGFTQLKSEPCIFFRSNNKQVICIIGIYVDDMLIMGLNEEINSIIHKIMKKFKISNYGKAKYILGITIERNNTCYYIHQRNFIENMLTNVTN